MSISGKEQLFHLQRSFGITKIEKAYLSEMPYFMNKSVVVVGMVKDAESRIESLLNTLEQLSCMFGSAAILIFESNSIDSTPQILQKWQSHHINCSIYKFHPKKKYTNDDKWHKQIKSHNALIMKRILNPDIDPAEKFTSTMYTRLDRYVMYRNYLLDETQIAQQQFVSIGQDKSCNDVVSDKFMNQNCENAIQSLSNFNNFDYLISVDMDIFTVDNHSILREIYFGMTKHENNNKPYSVLCGNGMKDFGWYYDSFATILETGEWFWEMDRYFRTNILHKNRFTNVLSCFGAMAVYNYKHITDLNCRYLTFNEALKIFPEIEIYSEILYIENKIHGVCEHIPFHLCLHKNELRLGIARDAYVYYGFS